MGKYYVYGLIDPRDQKIKYVGKGCGNRMYNHVRQVVNHSVKDKNYTKYNAIKEILKEFDNLCYEKLFETDDELEAYKKEKELIIKHNTLYPNGWNLVLGRGSTAGRELSEEHKIKIGLANKNKKISDSQKEYLRNLNKGKKLSEYTKKKISDSLKGKIHRDNRELLKIKENEKVSDTVNQDLGTQPENTNAEEKLFTQKEVDSIVKGRLSRIEAKYADYDTLRSEAEEFRTKKQEIEDLRKKAGKIEELEAMVNEHYTELYESIPESKRTLIPEQLSQREKLAYIKTNKSILFETNSKTIPSVPELNKPSQNSPNNFGGYESLAQWSISDPVGYRKAHKQY